MNYIKVLLLLLFVHFLAIKGFGQGADTLKYNPEKKLTWSDFKGKPKPTDQHKGAEITVTINLKVKKVSFWSGRITYDVYALALKNKSWVKTPYKDDYTLAHEQLHFDIAHIFAETLEIELNNSKRSAGQKDEVGDLLNKCIAAMGDYQDLYDRETHGGNNTAKQKEWAGKVKADLAVIN